MTRTEQWRIVLLVLAVVVPIGSLIGSGLGYLLGSGSTRSIWAGAIIGLLVAGGMNLFNVAWAVGLTSRQWREAPFLVVLVSRSLTWLAIIVAGISLPLLTVGGIPWSELWDQTLLLSVAISFVAALIFNFVAQVNRLLGRGVLIGLIVGRYHRPREEVRVFLFIDLRGSTPIAEQLGNLRYHAFLKRFVSDVSQGAIRHGAEVHRSVGDGIVLTWTERRGLTNADCIRAVFAVADQLEQSSSEYDAEFDVRPRFWAGLHMGPVVTGEIGTVKHEIVYLGDTPNTAARVEQACRQFQRSFLASEAVIRAVALPDEIIAENLGPIELRGVESSLELFALEKKD